MAIRFLTILLSAFFLLHSRMRKNRWSTVLTGRNSSANSEPKVPSSLQTNVKRNTLFALDAGTVRDEFQVFRWDGVKRSFAGHNQNQDLRSAMRNSAVWVYERFAKEIGENKARRYLKQMDMATPTLRLTEPGRNWMLRSKTGWEGRFGWWRGWVKWPAGPVFFVLNIDTPNRADDLFKREAIARAILRSVDALPSN